jgi:hypothetical protein
MTKRFSSQMLRSLRNDLPITRVLELLDVPAKISEGHFRFLCPICSEFHSATNPKTNLARCFRCERNFNPIDLVMLIRRCDFVGAVTFLSRLDCRKENGT